MSRRETRTFDARRAEAEANLTPEQQRLDDAMQETYGLSLKLLPCSTCDTFTHSLVRGQCAGCREAGILP